MKEKSDTYLTIASPATGQYKDRGSKFMAFGYPVLSEAKVKEMIGYLKKEYHDARHHCYAFRLDPENNLFRYSDDGEPSGTAGKPIFGQIISAGLYEVLIVVVRYFGGTLLGTGGLFNAYKLAARDAINHSKIIHKVIEDTLTLYFDYDQMNAVMQVMNREHLTILTQDFGTSCRLELKVRRTSTEKMINLFLSKGKINVKKNETG